MHPRPQATLRASAPPARPTRPPQHSARCTARRSTDVRRSAPGSSGTVPDTGDRTRRSGARTSNASHACVPANGRRPSPGRLRPARRRSVSGWTRRSRTGCGSGAAGAPRSRPAGTPRSRRPCRRGASCRPIGSAHGTPARRVLFALLLAWVKRIPTERWPPSILAATLFPSLCFRPGSPTSRSLGKIGSPSEDAFPSSRRSRRIRQQDPAVFGMVELGKRTGGAGPGVSVEQELRLVRHVRPI